MLEENVELVRDAFAAWERGDLDWLDRHTDPQVEITQPPNLPGTSTYTGKEGMQEALRDWPSQWEEYRIELSEATGLDQGRVLAMTRQVGRGKGSGVKVEAEFAFVFTVRQGSSCAGRCSRAARRPSKPPGSRISRFGRRLSGDDDRSFRYIDEDVEFTAPPDFSGGGQTFEGTPAIARPSPPGFGSGRTTGSSYASCSRMETTCSSEACSADAAKAVGST